MTASFVIALADHWRTPVPAAPTADPTNLRDLEQRCRELATSAATVADRGYWHDQADRYRNRRICEATMLAGWATATKGATS